MLYHLLFPLREYWFPFNVFRYITFRAAMAAATAFVLTLIFVPLVIRYVRQRGHTERISEYVPQQHRRKAGTPTSGGLAFLPAVGIAVLLWAKLTVPFVYMALFVLLWMALLGFWDDRIKLEGERKQGLSKWWKLFFQGVLSLLVVLFVYWVFGPYDATRTQSLFFKNLYFNLGPFYFFFVILVFLGTTNAVNITDGLDGLAAGAALAPMGVFAVVAYITGHKVLAEYLNIRYFPGAGELSIFAAAFIGALLGFLWFNAYPAEVFMGDTGSQALGGAFAILAILTKQELLLALAGGLFVLEALSVLIQVTYFHRTGGRRLFRKAPIHHHFEELGWPEPKIVVRFWILSMVFGLLALATLKIR